MIPGSPQPAGNFPDLQRDGQLASLASQQRRIRHIRSVAARNIQLLPIKKHTGETSHNFADDLQATSSRERLKQSRSLAAVKSASTSSFKSSDVEEWTDVSQLHMYYTLHTESTAPAFYTSEKIKGSLNPMWKNLNLDLQFEGSNLNLAEEALTVRVWYTGSHSDNSSANVCIRWDIHLSGLVYLGSKILGDQVYRHAPNSLIFGLRDGYYGASSCVQLDPAAVQPPALSSTLSVSRPLVAEVDGSLIRHSYTVRSLVRVQTVLRAIKQTEGHVSQIRQSIACRLEQTKSLQAKIAEREMALLRVGHLREDVQWRVLHQQQHLKTVLEELQIANQSKEQCLLEYSNQLTADFDELHERKKAYFDIRERLLKTDAQLLHRKKQLLAELAFIYPIQQIPNSDHTIVDVRLPQSEDLLGHNENMLAVSLGYTCHLVMMISGCLDVPLRYPMEHRGSRSVIYDYIIDTLPDKEREFPLFSKGKQKYQFQYGVYLLNKNIAQLRYYCGMSTPDLRITLSNLQTLLCDRLGVSPNQNDAFSNQHKLVPPSFGGPQQRSLLHSSTPPPTSTISIHISQHAPVQHSTTIPTQSNNASTLKPVGGADAKSSISLETEVLNLAADTAPISTVSGFIGTEALNTGAVPHIMPSQSIGTDDLKLGDSVFQSSSDIENLNSRTDALSNSKPSLSIETCANKAVSSIKAPAEELSRQNSSDLLLRASEKLDEMANLAAAKLVSSPDLQGAVNERAVLETNDSFKASGETDATVADNNSVTLSDVSRASLLAPPSEFSVVKSENSSNGENVNNGSSNYSDVSICMPQFENRTIGVSVAAAALESVESYSLKDNSIDEYPSNTSLKCFNASENTIDTAANSASYNFNTTGENANTTVFSSNHSSDYLDSLESMLATEDGTNSFATDSNRSSINTVIYTGEVAPEVEIINVEAEPQKYVGRRIEESVKQTGTEGSAVTKAALEGETDVQVANETLITEGYAIGVDLEGANSRNYVQSSPSHLVSAFIQRNLSDIYRVSSSDSLQLDDENAIIGMAAAVPSTNKNEASDLADV